MSSKETQNVRVTNNPWSTVGFIFWGCIIGWFMFVAGCDACKGTNSGTQCFGKSLGEVYKDLKTGFDVGNK